MQTLERLGALTLTEVDLGDFTVRGVLIAGEERVVVWDTLSHPDDMQVFLPSIGGRELAIVYSHADWDHIWGPAGLPHGRAAIIGHAECRERFATEVPQALGEKMAEDPGHWQAVQLLPPTVTFEREFRVDLGGETLFLHHLPGHTSDSIVGFLPEEGVLLAGDAVEMPLPLVPAACDLARWIAELRRWLAEQRVATVIPAHGLVGGPEILARNISYLEQLLAGRGMVMPEPLSAFYRETHLANIRAWCGEGSQTRSPDCGKEK